MKKNSYPHNDFEWQVRPKHNVQKWMGTMKDIFSLAQKGYDFKVAFDSITSGWDDMEKLDFKNWMNFYQENAHAKYKTAFRVPSLIDNGHGSFIPNVDNLKASLPFKQPDMTPFSPSRNDSETEESRQENVKKKIQALVSRLSAAERLATNPEVQVALKKCIDMPLIEWLSMLQQLKREIQLAPMRSTSLVLMEDIVVKNANRAIASGKANAGYLLLKIAQALPGADIPAMNPGVVPMGMQPVAPSDGADGEDAIQEFLKNMNGDISQADDESENDEDEFASITVTAQLAPEETAQEQAPDAPQEELAVTEDDLAPVAPVEPVAAEPLDAIDLALENVKISDIVARLEGIASLFKNRQIARQLSVVDLMMDKMGIAPFFPTLAEAMRSALESNQYCQSRIEEILAKLRGTMETPISQELERSQEVGAEEAAPNALQQRLQQDENAEKARKERRKQLQEQEENEAMKAKQAPEQVDAPAEIAGPTEVQTQPEAVRPIG